MADTVEDYTAAQAAEYGTFVANTVIMFNDARAYNAGDAVPASNVERYHYLESGLVRRVEEPAPQASEPEPAPQGEPIVQDQVEGQSNG